MPETVFRSTAPEVLDAFKAWGDEHDAYIDSLRGLEAEFGLKVRHRTGGVMGYSFAGFERPEVGVGDEDGAWPEGLRLDSKWRILVPDKRTAEGKALAKRFGKIKHAAPDLPGMPSEVFGGHHLYSPGYMLDGGTLWATWGCGVDRLTDPGLNEDGVRRHRADLVDLTLWSVARLSEFYAMKERRDEQDAEGRAAAEEQEAVDAQP